MMSSLLTKKRKLSMLEELLSPINMLVGCCIYGIKYGINMLIGG